MSTWEQNRLFESLFAVRVYWPALPIYSSVSSLLQRLLKQTIKLCWSLWAPEWQNTNFLDSLEDAHNNIFSLAVPHAIVTGSSRFLL